MYVLLTNNNSETGLNWTKNYYQFTVSVDYVGCDTGMVFEEYRLIICFYSSHQLTNSLDSKPYPSRKELPTWELLTYLSYLVSKVTLTKEEYLLIT